MFSIRVHTDKRYLQINNAFGICIAQILYPAPTQNIASKKIKQRCQPMHNHRGNLGLCACYTHPASDVVVVVDVVRHVLTCANDVRAPATHSQQACVSTIYHILNTFAVCVCARPRKSLSSRHVQQHSSLHINTEFNPQQKALRVRERLNAGDDAAPMIMVVMMPRLAVQCSRCSGWLLTRRT